MAVQATRKVLNVFLASPGDLADERSLAREGVEEINRYVRLLGWYVELLGWEDTLPGFSRPQHIINRDVDSCDLFVGLLWRRWGQPTGEYGSGFEEEFERAKHRRLKDGCPEIWLCFKQVDPDQLKDPGNQLKRVMTFRKSLEEAKELFFREFRDCEDWKAKFREWLLSYVIELNQSSSTAQPVVSGTRLSVPVPEIPETSRSTIIQEKVDQGPASSQLLDTFRAASNAIPLGEFDSIMLVDGKVSGDIFAAARSYLFGVSWLSALNTGEVLGTHATNLLFLQREQLQLTPVERFTLSRTLIADISQTLPGWFWTRHWDAHLTETILFDRSLRDSNWIVRQQALELLNASGIPIEHIEQPTKEDFIQAILRDDSQSVLISGLKYLASCLTPDDLPIFKNAISEDSSVPPDKALETEQLILVRKGQSSHLRNLLPLLKPGSTDVIAELTKRIEELDESSLLAGLQHANSSLRALALRVLARRGKLSEEQLKQLVADSSSEVKRAAYEEMIKQNVAITSEEIRNALPRTLLLDFLGSSGLESLVFELFKSRDYEELSSMVDWFSLDGPIAYKTLAMNHFSRISSHLRADLHAGFERVRLQSIDKIKPREAVAMVTKIWSEKNMDPFIRREFTAAALAGLAANGQASDAAIARSNLNDESEAVRKEAVRILDRFGDASDLEALLSMAITNWGELQEVAARAALKLAPGPEGAGRHLLASEKPKLVALAVRSLLNENEDKVRVLLEPLLDNKDDTIRLNALFFFLKCYQDGDLEKLLQSYLAKGRYYYNVVCWLDRILYAPPPLKDSFRRELEKRFSE